MRLFVISDIHGSNFYFEKILNLFEKEKADFMIICGDYLNHGPRNPLPKDYAPKIVAEKLNSIKDKIIGVQGNCDSEVDQMLLEFPIMSSTANVLLPTGNRVFIHHGHSYSENNVEKFVSDKTIVVSGHTHIPKLEIKNYENGKQLLFLNPGSISIPKEESSPCYGLIENLNDFLTIKIISIEGEILKSVDFNKN